VIRCSAVHGRRPHDTFGRERRVRRCRRPCPDMLVLADDHCLRDQALAVCGRTDAAGIALYASSLETFVNMVAAGYVGRSRSLSCPAEC
jgi:hypothetical protein